MSDKRSIPATDRTSVQSHMQGTHPTKPGDEDPSYPSPHPITVVLADDQAVVRIGIRKLLSRASDIVVVGEASNGVEAIQLVTDLSPDILLLDMEMPVLDGVEVAHRLREANAPVKVVALSAYNDKQYILSIFEQGTAGYLTKGEAPEEMIELIRSLAG